MLFGRKKVEGKTFLLLDIESGSVGGALLRIEEGEAPKLFAEQRIQLLADDTRDAHSLRQRAANATLAVARGLAEVAARMRGHEATAPIGTVTRAAAFLAAPWGTPNLAVGKPTFNEELMDTVHATAAATFDVPLNFHAHASAALHGTRALLPYEPTYLICMPGGEVTEILSVEQGTVRSYGTLPVGRHTMVRTLRSHAGLSEPEARSALRLSASHLQEPLRAAGQHIAQEFGSLARDLNWHAHERVYSVAHDGEWFAQALAQSNVAKQFPPDAVVRHVRASHASPHFAAHATTPDLPLMFDALFVDSHYR